ncbi:MAG: peptide chain release factor N(5)-glutamine methyltransferase [Arachnia sp.]
MSEAAHEVALRLAASGSPSPGPEARQLVAHVLGVEVARLIAAAPPTAEQAAEIERLTARRAAGEPLQHLTGVAYFRHEALSVGPGVFIPRPETEELVGWALRALADRPAGHRRVVELCAGSGAISAALATEIGGVDLHAVELSPEAFGYLERNLAGRGVRVAQGDMATAFPELDGTVDLVIVNPPYIPAGHRPFLPSDVVDHEPDLALFSGPDGLDAIRVAAATAGRLLAPGGLFATEHDDSHQDAVIALLEERGFGDVRGHRDLAGRPRFVTALGFTS